MGTKSPPDRIMALSVAKFQFVLSCGPDWNRAACCLASLRASLTLHEARNEALHFLTRALTALDASKSRFQRQ
jgi:hypothetical protein